MYGRLADAIFLSFRLSRSGKSTVLPPFHSLHGGTSFLTPRATPAAPPAYALPSLATLFVRSTLVKSTGGFCHSRVSLYHPECCCTVPLPPEPPPELLPIWWYFCIKTNAVSITYQQNPSKDMGNTIFISSFPLLRMFRFEVRFNSDQS